MPGEGTVPGDAPGVEPQGLEDPRAPWEQDVEDLPAASNFVIPTFACPQLADRIIGRPDSTANVAWFCDREVDAKIEAAMAAQEQDILSAADLWTAVDRAVTDAAPFVPYATLLNATLVSPRVGNIQSNPLTGVLLTQMWLTDRK